MENFDLDIEKYQEILEAEEEDKNFEEDIESMKEIEDKFVEMSSLVSFNNEVPARMIFYSLMGAYLKNVKIRLGANEIDLRLSFIWLQPSRTGKGQLFKVAEDICKDLSISYTMETDFTTAGLIGTIDTEAQKHNIKYGLSPENPYIEGRHRDYEYKDPVIYGDLCTKDIIFVPEAKKVFSERAYSEQLLTDLQPVLDYPGRVYKRLAKGEIMYECFPTLMMTSYAYKGMERAITEQGFFQRCQFLVRNLTIEEVQEMRDYQDEEALNGQSFDNYRKLKRQVVKMLKKIDTKEPVSLTLTKSAVDMKKELTNQFLDRVKTEVTGEKFPVALSFSQTITDIIYKTAGIRCALRGETEITKEHVLPTLMSKDWIYFEMAKSVIEGLQLEEKGMSFQLSKALLEFKKSREKLNITTFVDLLRKKFDISYDKSRTIVHKMINQNLIHVERGAKNVKFLVRT